MVVDGEVIGVIGASFAAPEEDEQIAKAELTGLNERSAAGACFGLGDA